MAPLMWPWLSPESQACPPDFCMVQRYDAWRGPRGAHARPPLHAHAPRPTRSRPTRSHAHALTRSRTPVRTAGAFMGMHSDMRPTHQEQKVASLGDVIGVSAGSDMNFWFGTSVGAKVAKERHAVLLRDGDTWV